MAGANRRARAQRDTHTAGLYGKGHHQTILYVWRKRLRKQEPARFAWWKRDRHGSMHPKPGNRSMSFGRSLGSMGFTRARAACGPTRQGRIVRFSAWPTQICSVARRESRRRPPLSLPCSASLAREGDAYLRSSLALDQATRTSCVQLPSAATETTSHIYTPYGFSGFTGATPSHCDLSRDWNAFVRERAYVYGYISSHPCLDAMDHLHIAAPDDVGVSYVLDLITSQERAFAAPA